MRVLAWKRAPTKLPSKQLYKYTLDGDGHKSAKAAKTRPAIATDVEVQA